MTGMQCSGRVPVRVGKDPSPSLEPGSLAPHWEPGSTQRTGRPVRLGGRELRHDSWQNSETCRNGVNHDL